MSLSCLDNIIGISPTCVSANFPAPRSGLYVTDLEGITVALASKIVSGEDVNGVNLLKKKIDFAVGLVWDDMYLYLKDYFKINEYLNFITAGNFTPNRFLSPFNAYRGLQIKKIKRDSRMVTIKRVKILSGTTLNNVELRIIDGTYQTSIPVNLIAGQILEVELNYKAIFDEVYITLDNALISVSEGTIDENNSKGGCGCRNTYTTVKSPNSPETGIQVLGWSGAATDNKSYGLSVDIEMKCEIEKFACTIADSLKYILLYKAGIEIVKEWMHSNRVTQATTVDVDQAVYLLDSWQKIYDSKYKTFVDRIRPLINSLGDPCVECKGVSYVYQI